MGRWDQVQRIFLEGSSLKGDERSRFVERACDGDAELLSEVQRLLDGESAADGEGFLAPQAGDAIAASVPPDLAIDGYEIIRRISEGGQGVVYQALQRGPNRKVAVKVLLHGRHAGRSAIRRFEREIELAAQLKHPNVIAIYHSGETKEGLPFFVMDYVRGVPLDQYVRDKELVLENALELFRKVCAGVQYAHQRGVIHRDLKPSNVLVASDGEPKILDFGLAKLVEGPVETLVSMSRDVVGTLPYISPEQARANPDEIDTRTDVYSLGVMLYELLTGTYPYQVHGPITDVLRAIQDEPPKPPRRSWTGDGATVQKANRRSRGTCPIDDEVETIVLTALAKDRDRRYQSAGELSEDCRRYLEGEAIEAKRDSAWYVLKSSVRRHKAPVAAVVIVLVTLLLGIAGTSWQWREAVKARELSDLSLTLAEDRAKELAESRDATQRALAVAEDRRAEATLQLQVSQFLAAQNHLKDFDASKAREALERVPLEERAWEWDYLWRQTDMSISSGLCGDGPVLSASFSPALGSTDVLALTDSGLWLCRDVGAPEPVNILISSVASSMTWSPDGRRFAYADGNSVHVCDASYHDSCCTTYDLPLAEPSATRLVLSHDYEYLATIPVLVTDVVAKSHFWRLDDASSSAEPLAAFPWPAWLEEKQALEKPETSEPTQVASDPDQTAVHLYIPDGGILTIDMSSPASFVWDDAFRIRRGISAMSFSRSAVVYATDLDQLIHQHREDASQRWIYSHDHALSSLHYLGATGDFAAGSARGNVLLGNQARNDTRIGIGHLAPVLATRATGVSYKAVTIDADGTTKSWWLADKSGHVDTSRSLTWFGSRTSSIPWDKADAALGFRDLAIVQGEVLQAQASRFGLHVRTCDPRRLRVEMDSCRIVSLPLREERDNDDAILDYALSARGTAFATITTAGAVRVYRPDELLNSASRGVWIAPGPDAQERLEAELERWKKAGGWDIDYRDLGELGFYINVTKIAPPWLSLQSELHSQCRSAAEFPTGMELSEDGNYLMLSAMCDARSEQRSYLEIWNLPKRRRVFSQADAEFIGFLDDLNAFVVERASNGERAVAVLDGGTGDEICDRSNVRALQTVLGTRVLLAGEDKNTIILVDGRLEGDLVIELPGGPELRSVVGSAAADRLVIIGADPSRTGFVDLETGKRVGSFEGDARLISGAWSDDGRRFFGAFHDGSVRISTPSGRELLRLEGLQTQTDRTQMLYSSGVLCQVTDATIRCWDSEPAPRLEPSESH